MCDFRLHRGNQPDTAAALKAQGPPLDGGPFYCGRAVAGLDDAMPWLPVWSSEYGVEGYRVNGDCCQPYSAPGGLDAQGLRNRAEVGVELPFLCASFDESLELVGLFAEEPLKAFCDRLVVAGAAKGLHQHLIGAVAGVSSR